MRNKIAALLALGAACFALPAGAAMYRCGNVFQDRPCDAQVDQQVIRPGKGAGKAVVAPVAAQPASAPASTSQPASRPQTTAATAPAAPARPDAATNPACGNLREQRNALDTRLRSATNANTIEMLQRQRRTVEKNLADARC